MTYAVVGVPDNVEEAAEVDLHVQKHLLLAVVWGDSPAGMGTCMDYVIHVCPRENAHRSEITPSLMKNHPCSIAGRFNAMDQHSCQSCFCTEEECLRATTEAMTILQPF